MKNLVLSLFPGIDLLGRAFEEEGFCVVRGPDKLWGGDAARFHPPAGRFDGVIGGPPCQKFSTIGRLQKATNPEWDPPDLIPEFERCVSEAKPRAVADGRALPFHDASFKAVLCDPPYSDQCARNLYGTENPRPSWLLREAARVVVPCGRVGMLHVAVPFAPPQCRLVGVWGVTTGVGFRIRALTVYEREQDSLPLVSRGGK